MSTDGRFLAGIDHSLKQVVWLDRADSSSQTWAAHDDEMTAARFSPDGSQRATCSQDRTVRVWNLQTQLCTSGPFGHTSPVEDVEFSEDGRFLLSWSEDATVSVWDLHSDSLAAPPFSGAGNVLARFRPGHPEEVVVLTSEG